MGKRLKIRIRISQKLRLAVYKRDRYICGYCGKKVLKSKYRTIDHIISVKRWGGKTTLNNLVTSCRRCNSHKKQRLPGEHGVPKLKWHAGKRVAKVTVKSPISRSVSRESKISYRRR